MRSFSAILVAMILLQMYNGAIAKSDIDTRRKIYFPAKSIGKVYTVSTTNPVFLVSLGSIRGRFIGPASGTYTIPKNEKVFLELDPGAAEDSSNLKGLGPDTCFAIRIFYAETNDNLLRELSKLKSLYRLDMRECIFSEQGLRALSQLDYLERLAMEGCAIKGDCNEALHQFKKLRYLNISGCHTAPATVAQLFNLPHLEYFAIARCGINNEALKGALAAKHLKFLDLSSNAEVTGAGLANLKSCRSLTNLRIKFTGIRARDLLMLKGLPLHLVDLHESSISASLLNELQIAFPGCMFTLAKKEPSGDYKMLFAPTTR